MFRGDEFKQLFRRAAKAYNEAYYNDALEEMKKVNPDSVDAFKSYNPRLFCRRFMNTDTKVDVIVNNLAETFNGYIINARTKHLLYMLEEIRTALMQRLPLKRDEMAKSPGSICPRIQLKLDKAKAEAANCVVVPSIATLFQVTEKMDVLNVDLDARNCTCGVWALTGIPCQHAVTSIFICRRNAEDFVAHWYTKETYNLSYVSSIPPCVGERHWPKVDLPLNPPPIKIGPGRPRKNRIKDPFEDPKKPGRLTRHGLQMTCSICKEPNHKKRKCPNKDNIPPQLGDGPRPRKKRTTGVTVGQGSQIGDSNDVLNATAQPTRTSRGGRVIRGGRGSRGGRGRGKAANTSGKGRGGGRGGGARGGGRNGRGQRASCIFLNYF